jgi:DtxR family Mn-dependent transcriptional regulator
VVNLHIVLTLTEENYIKAIYTLQQRNGAGEVSVNEIADRMNTRPATVTDMLRKLSDKELIHYEKYRKVQLTEEGRTEALQILRKHRLWETFLHDVLRFSWDEVHEVAEQLEHIHSAKLIDRLDELLGTPEFDPHGDPIPNSRGELPPLATLTLHDAPLNQWVRIMAVKDTSSPFLQQLERFRLRIGAVVCINERLMYDNSLFIKLKEDGVTFQVSNLIAENILVQPANDQ